MSLERSLELRGIYTAASGNTGIDGTLTSKTTVTTVTGLTVTYTGAQLIGGVIDHDPGAADAVTLDTGTNIEAEMPNKTVGASFRTCIKNNASQSAEDITLTLNSTGLTVVPVQTTIVIRQNEMLSLLFVRTAANTYTVHTLGITSNNSNVKSGFAHYINPAATSIVGCHAEANIVDGNKFGGLVAQPDAPRTLILTIIDANGSITAGTLTVVGIDVHGVSQTAVYSLGSLVTGTVTIILDDAGKNIAWATISAIDVAGMADDDVGTDKFKLGYGNIFGLPCSVDGQLVNVYKYAIDGVNTAVGVVNTLNATAVVTGTDGAKDYAFWYTYV